MNSNRTRNFIVILALAVAAGACNSRFNPAAPTFSDGPHSTLKWELWRGDPRCVTGCPGGQAEPLGNGSEGTYSFASRTDTGHLLDVRVQFPDVAGHTVRLTVVNEAHLDSETRGQPRVEVAEAVTGDKLFGIMSGDSFPTRRTPGTYPITVTVEETGPDLSQSVMLRAVIQLTIS